MSVEKAIYLFNLSSGKLRDRDRAETLVGLDGFRSDAGEVLEHCGRHTRVPKASHTRSRAVRARRPRPEVQAPGGEIESLGVGDREKGAYLFDRQFHRDEGRYQSS